MSQPPKKFRRVEFDHTPLEEIYGGPKSTAKTMNSLIETLNESRSNDSPEKRAADEKVEAALAQLKRPYAHRHGATFDTCALCKCKTHPSRKDAISDIIDEMAKVASGRACDILSIRETMKSIYVKMITRSVAEGKIDEKFLSATHDDALLEEIIDHFMFIDVIKIAITDKYSIITSIDNRQSAATVLSRLISAARQTSDMDLIIPISKIVFDGMRAINKNTSLSDQIVS